MTQLNLSIALAISFVALITISVSQNQLSVVLAIQNSTQTSNVNASGVNSSEQLTDLSSSPIFSKNTTIHSQYLTVTKVSARHTGDYYNTNTVFGNILNKSPVNVNGIDVWLALFNKTNGLMDRASGSVDFSTLKPNEDTNFKISYNNDPKNPIDHYMLFVFGKSQ